MADQPAKTDQTSKDKPFVFPDLNNYVVPSVEILLISGFGVLLCNYLFGLRMLSGDRRAVVSQNAIATKPAATIAPAATVPIVQSGTIAPTQVAANPVVVNGTHRALCSTSDQGLNFRPSAGFSTPLFAVPCGGVVTVTGNPVNVENETWSPVSYAGRNGWSATKLLQPLR